MTDIPQRRLRSASATWAARWPCGCASSAGRSGARRRAGARGRVRAAGARGADHAGGAGGSASGGDRRASSMRRSATRSCSATRRAGAGRARRARRLRRPLPDARPGEHRGDRGAPGRTRHRLHRRADVGRAGARPRRQHEPDGRLRPALFERQRALARGAVVQGCSGSASGPATAPAPSWSTTCSRRSTSPAPPRRIALARAARPRSGAHPAP